jgi:hypothetical protein
VFECFFSFTTLTMKQELTKNHFLFSKNKLKYLDELLN